MLKKVLLASVLVVFVGALVFGAVNRTLAQTAGEGEGVSGYARDESSALPAGGGNGGNGGGKGGGNGGSSGGGYAGYGSGEAAALPPAVPGSLSADETAALLYMREEEKLAHDVYVTLYDRWGLATFRNIAASEQTHTDAVLALIQRYGLTDPASTQIGVFTDPELQALYNELVARGSTSLAEAIRVGGAIEEIDILDLEERLTQVDNADIVQVFNNLLRGSGNHLRAFVSALSSQTGQTYEPQYLSAAAYEAIIAGTTGNGGGGQGGGRRNGRP